MEKQDVLLKILDHILTAEIAIHTAAQYVATANKYCCDRSQFEPELTRAADAIADLQKKYNDVCRKEKMWWLMLQEEAAE